MTPLNLGFSDPLFETWAQRTLLNIAEGGCEIGEVAALARRIPAGDRTCWFNEWTALADRLFDTAQACESRGHRISARQLFQRASTYYRVSYPLLFGVPLDPRVRSGFANETLAFRRAAALFDTPLQALEIPFENAVMPAWFYSGGPGKRPLLICTNGYDETLHTMHYATAAAAQRRGYHVLTFDGPGQGQVLIEQGIPLRPDWENVVSRVIDVMHARDDIDTRKIALLGWSFGGYLAPRAAAFEPRIKALIADPGQWDLLDAAHGLFRKFGADELADALPSVPDSALEPVRQAIENDPALRWTLVQRGFWVHGVNTLADYFRAMADFRLSGCATQITCPTLITSSEGDPIAMNAARLYEAVKGPKTRVEFTQAEGAAGHCETLARSTFHQRVFDWLDDIFAA